MTSKRRRTYIIARKKRRRKKTFKYHGLSNPAIVYQLPPFQHTVCIEMHVWREKTDESNPIQSNTKRQERKKKVKYKTPNKSRENRKYQTKIKTKCSIGLYVCIEMK